MSDYKRELLGLGKGKCSTECHATFKLCDWKLTLGVITCLLHMFSCTQIFKNKNKCFTVVTVFSNC